ncbi:MAG: hypothetical protein K2P66_13855, partial [Lachnospiraceae bacterium]|nr:hypothetical protein [Lachnospiraceae bacterium]
MEQFAARRATSRNARKQAGNFGAMLESTEEAAEQEKTGQAAGNGSTEAENDPDYRKFLREKMEEMRANIKNGTIQPKIQIGAEAYTQEE